MATVTKKDLNQLEERIDSKIDKAVSDLSGIIRDFAEQVDSRFAEVNDRLEALETKYDHILTTMDSLAKNLDDFTTEMRARDAEVARLKRWIEQIAEKTGVKLEY